MPSKRLFVLPRVARAYPFLVVLAAIVIVAGACAPEAGQAGHVDARIGSSDVFTWDPAYQGDAGTASVLAQVYEGLTAFDAQSNVQPALAQAWTADDNGHRITFTLRPGLTYSDGTPIGAPDVVDSWLRLIDPARPSPLSSLLGDVQGATDYQGGRVGRDAVGLHAQDNMVVVDLRRSATYFLAVTASPSLAVVPPSMIGQVDQTPPTVVSGAYMPTTEQAGVIRLSANQRYWAGVPPLDVIELVTDNGGTSGVQSFTDGDLDYVGIGSGDASWIAYDPVLGPQLRRSESFGLSYYGFDTQVAPFDKAEVRLAFAEAVDWNRIVTLAESTPATSMIPIGVPGRDDADHRPRYDPAGARALLESAGYPGGAGFPEITLATYGVGFEQTVANELEANLGVHVTVEARDFEHYLEQVGAANTPTMWTLSWIADYPHAHDFLGLLLETGSSSNTGRWSNADYDHLIEQAAATADPEQQAIFYGQAQDILAREAPVVPVTYDESWALSRTGLEGALQSGVGLIRYAGLAWAPGTGR